MGYRTPARLRLHATGAVLLLFFAVAAGAGEARAPRHLDVSIAVFDPGVPDDAATRRQREVFPRIREVEARFLPFLLRETLADSEEWGAVRVVPQADTTAELLVTARILRSDGASVALTLRATDALGRRWLDGLYTYEVPVGQTRGDAYQGLFDRLASELVAARDRFTTAQLTEIVDVSLLRYASGLSSTAFAGYLRRDEAGLLRAARLPSADDPLFARVQRIREFEFLFTDTLDEQYADHYRDIAPVYDEWRAYRRQIAAYRESESARLQNREPNTRRGSYEAMKKRYDDYRWAKIEEQNLGRWARGFDNEVAPTLMELEGRVVELRGGIDARYTEWRRILTALYDVESGAGSASPEAPAPVRTTP